MIEKKNNLKTGTVLINGTIIFCFLNISKATPDLNTCTNVCRCSWPITQHKHCWRRRQREACTQCPLLCIGSWRERVVLHLQSEVISACTESLTTSVLCVWNALYAIRSHSCCDTHFSPHILQLSLCCCTFSRPPSADSVPHLCGSLSLLTLPVPLLNSISVSPWPRPCPYTSSQPWLMPRLWHQRWKIGGGEKRRTEDEGGHLRKGIVSGWQRAACKLEATDQKEVCVCV